MSYTTLPFEILSQLDGQPEPEKVSLADVKQAETVINQTTCMAPLENRLQALNILKSAVDRIDPKTYCDFCEYGTRYPQEQLPAFYEKHPGLYWQDHAFDKILAGVQNESVPAGQVFLWHVYNMGYVVKTPSKCFAIDLHHRRAEELVPYLDFCGITHNHDDHYTFRFAQAMNRGHKPVITNFMANDGYPQTDGDAGYSKASTRTLDFGDVRVTTYESDHNAKLRNFVQPILVTCQTGNDKCVIFSSGDSCNAAQLHPEAQKIDFWVVHPYVGLKIEEGATLLKPAMTLCSHLEEFHHRIDQWRWTWRQGYQAAQKVWNIGLDAIVPCWGDKIVWKAH